MTPETKLRLDALELSLDDAEYESYKKDNQTFLAAYSRRLRAFVGYLSCMQTPEVDTCLRRVYDPSIPLYVRARAAADLYAWHLIIDAYSNPNRKYYFNWAGLRPLIEQDPEALYYVKTMIEPTISRDTKKKLSTLHPEIAKRYDNFCKAMIVAEEATPDIRRILAPWDY